MDFIERRKRHAERLKVDYNYKISCIETKIIMANGYAGGERYVRYGENIFDTITNQEIEFNL